MEKCHRVKDFELKIFNYLTYFQEVLQKNEEG